MEPFPHWGENGVRSGCFEDTFEHDDADAGRFVARPCDFEQCRLDGRGSDGGLLV
jgi:hypothetical protein